VGPFGRSICPAITKFPSRPLVGGRRHRARIAAVLPQHGKRSRFAALAGQVHAGARPPLVSQRRSIPTSLGRTCDLCCQPLLSRPWCCTGLTSPWSPSSTVATSPTTSRRAVVETAGAFHRHHAPHRDQQRVLIGDVGACEQSDAAEGDGADALAANFLASGIWGDGREVMCRA
jgi:hypothetical protein